MASRGTVGSLMVQLHADLSGLRMEVKEMEKVFSSGFSNIKSSAAQFGRDLASSLGVGLSVGAVIGFAKQVIDLGSRLKDLQVQTGISAQTLSGLKSVLEENGTSLEAFATGIFRIQKELGTIKNESDPTAQAIKQLGLNLDQLRNADTDTFLTLISNALAKIENPINRSALAFQLMGRQARELVPALLEMAGKIDELRSKGLTDADVKTLDDFADAWTRASNAAKLFAASEIAGVLKELAKDWQDVSGALEYFNKLAGTQSLTSLTKGLQNTQREVISLYIEILKLLRVAPLLVEFLTFNKFDFGSKRFTDWINQLKDVQANIGRRSFAEGLAGAETAPGGRFKPPVDDAALKKAADEAKRLAEELRKLAESIGEGNDKLEEQILELRSGAIAAEDYRLTQQEMREAAKGMTADILHEQERRRALTEQLREEKLARDDLHRLAEQSRKDTPFVEESTRFGLNADELKEFAENENRVNEETKKLKDEWAKLQEQSQIGFISDDGLRRITELGLQFNHLAEQIQKVGDALNIPQEKIDDLIAGFGNDFRRQIEQIKPPKTEAEQLGESIGESITSGIRNTLMGIETGQQSVGEGLKNMLRNIGLELQFLMFDESILKPMKAFAAGFVKGFFDEIGFASEAASKDLGEKLGKGLKDALQQATQDSGVAQWISRGFSWLAGLFGLGSAALGAGSGGGNIPIGGGGYGTIGGPVMAAGGPVLAFASGGMVPIMANQGEFVMNRRAVDSIGAANMSRMNQTGQMPGGGAQVIINGDIIPRQPNLSKDEVIQVVTNDFYNRGPAFQMNRQQSRG